MLIVGSGHIAYELGIPRRLADERAAAGEPTIDVVTLCPATAPAPPDDGEPTGHPMGGGGHQPGADAGPPAQFSRSLADFVAFAFDTNGGTLDLTQELVGQATSGGPWGEGKHPGEVKLWDASTGELLHVFTDPSSSNHRAA